MKPSEEIQDSIIKRIVQKSAGESYNPTTKRWERFCPECGKVCSYSNKKNRCSAVKLGRKCARCSSIGIFPSAETRLKLSISTSGSKNPNFGNGHKIKGDKNGFYGKTHTSENIEKSRLGATGRFWNEERKEEARIRTCERLRKLGQLSSNPIACKFIDDLNSNYGLNLQHAKNGGEIQFIGYRADGFDKVRNIWFEYDEPIHETRRRKLYDIKRQEDILKKFDGLFFRYSEKYQKFYTVNSGYSTVVSSIDHILSYTQGNRSSGQCRVN